MEVYRKQEAQKWVLRRGQAQGAAQRAFLAMSRNIFLKVSVIASEDTGICSSRYALPVFFLNTKSPVISLKCPLRVTCIKSH